MTTLDELKRKLDSHRPFPPAAQARLREFYLVEWTHNSTALEGNTLSLMETRVVLEGITVGGKTLREHLEVVDHRDAIEYLESYVQEDIPLTETFIRNVHKMTVKSTLPGEAGSYRKSGVLIAGSRHKPPQAVGVPALMREMVENHNTIWQREHPIRMAALLHWRTTYIHPFADGNGRTARLLMNFSLMQKGYPPVIFQKEKRLEYLDALEKASVNGDLEPFMELTAKTAGETLRAFLAVVSQRSD